MSNTTTQLNQVNPPSKTIIHISSHPLTAGTQLPAQTKRQDAPKGTLPSPPTRSLPHNTYNFLKTPQKNSCQLTGLPGGTHTACLVMQRHPPTQQQRDREKKRGGGLTSSRGIWCVVRAPPCDLLSHAALGKKGCQAMPSPRFSTSQALFWGGRKQERQIDADGRMGAASK